MQHDTLLIALGKSLESAIAKANAEIAAIPEDASVEIEVEAIERACAEVDMLAEFAAKLPGDSETKAKALAWLGED